MTATWNLYKKELRGYFVHPMAYVIMAVFLGISGFLFSLGLFTQRRVDFYPSVLGRMVFLMLFTTPALTMRLLAEEKKARTMALLLTSPIREFEIVLGKFLACFSYQLLVLALTGIFPLVLLQFGSPDLGQILAGYLGAALVVACLISLGIFASSLSDSQMMAAILGFGFSLFFWMVQGIEPYLRDSVSEGLATVVKNTSLVLPFWQFLQGSVSIHHVVFYLSFCFFFLYLTSQRLASQGWR